MDLRVQQRVLPDRLAKLLVSNLLTKGLLASGLLAIRRLAWGVLQHSKGVDLGHNFVHFNLPADTGSCRGVIRDSSRIPRMCTSCAKGVPQLAEIANSAILRETAAARRKFHDNFAFIVSARMSGSRSSVLTPA